MGEEANPQGVLPLPAVPTKAEAEETYPGPGNRFLAKPAPTPQGGPCLMSEEELSHE